MPQLDLTIWLFNLLINWIVFSLLFTSFHNERVEVTNQTRRLNLAHSSTSTNWNWC